MSKLGATRLGLVCLVVLMLMAPAAMWWDSHRQDRRDEIPQLQYGMALCGALDNWENLRPLHLMPCPKDGLVSGATPPYILVRNPIAEQQQP